MLVIGKQLFRWRWVDKAGGEYTHSTLPKDMPDHTNVLHLDVFRPKLEKRGFSTDSVKYACPLFSFRESTSRTKGKQFNYVQGILADFDSLPEGFSSYGELRQELAARFPDAVVFPSPNGKAKVCWFVKSYRQAIPDAAAVDFLQERIPDLFDHVDTSSSALSVAFLDAQAVACFHAFNELWGEDTSYIQSLPQAAGESIDFDSIVPSTHEYKAVSLDKLSPYLLDLRSFAVMSMSAKQAEAFTTLLCILSACPAMLTDEGMGLSSVILSNQLGVTQPTVSRWLRQLCDSGLIRWVGNRAVAGTKAKHYVAKHTALIDSIERNVPRATQEQPAASTKGGLVGVLERQLQTTGEGNDFRVKAAYHAAHAGYSLDELLDSVQTLIPDYFTTRQANVGKKSRGVNRRRQELTAAYKSALRKSAKAS